MPAQDQSFLLCSAHQFHPSLFAYLSWKWPSKAASAVRVFIMVMIYYWKIHLTNDRMKNITFLLDPDEYWTEIMYVERGRKLFSQYQKDMLSM